MQGVLATKKVEAEGILAIKTAEAEGLQRLLTCSTDAELVKFYLSVHSGLFNDVAGRHSSPLRQARRLQEDIMQL